MTRAGVAINGRFLTRRPTGVDRFARELLGAWLPDAAVRRPVRALRPASADPTAGDDLGLAVEPVGRLDGHGWEQVELSRACGDDVLLSLCNTGPIARRRQLAVVHDALALARPSTFGFAFRNWYRVLLTGLLKRADVLATVSRFSADELTRLVGRRPAGIEVVPESGEHVLRVPSEPLVLERLGIRTGGYVLAVGSLAPNKNLEGVVRASAQLRDLGYPLVAAGGANPRVFGDVAVDRAGYLAAGFVSDGELRALYEHAACFVFPSFYEGFGLPPLEAMHCGCPVVVADSSSLPEVCGDGAVYCDPEDPADIARQVRSVLTSEARREELRAAGLARARTFSWQRSAGRLEELVEGMGG